MRPPGWRRLPSSTSTARLWGSDHTETPVKPVCPNALAGSAGPAEQPGLEASCQPIPRACSRPSVRQRVASSASAAFSELAAAGKVLRRQPRHGRGGAEQPRVPGHAAETAGVAVVAGPHAGRRRRRRAGDPARRQQAFLDEPAPLPGRHARVRRRREAELLGQPQRLRHQVGEQRRRGRRRRPARGRCRGRGSRGMSTRPCRRPPPRAPPAATHPGRRRGRSRRRTAAPTPGTPRCGSRTART